MKKNVSIVIKRIIYAMAIFLVPFIVRTAIHLLGEHGVDYMVCIDVATSGEDLSKYKTKYESGEFGNNNIVIPDSLKKDKYKKKKATNDDNGSSGGNGNYGKPDWNNKDAWLNKNTYKGCMGQCTWFAWGRFYEIYGYDPKFNGNGNQCVDQLLAAHSDKFEKSSTPKAGAIFSGDSAHNHVGLVVGVSGDNVTIQEGNLDGEKVACYQGVCSKLMNCDSFGFAKNDWQEVTISLGELRNRYGNVVFANPKNTSHGGGKNNNVDK